MSKTGEEGRKYQTLQSLMGRGRGFGLSLKSSGKALKVQSWGNDTHSLALWKEPAGDRVYK